VEILVIGDVHGSFDRMVMYQEEQDPDLCLQVGDLEPVRDEDDLDELTGPEKYKDIKDFPPYWNGENPFLSKPSSLVATTNHGHSFISTIRPTEMILTSLGISATSGAQT